MPMLFCWVGGHRGLRMDAQDPVTGVWRSTDVRVPDVASYELTQYLVDVTLTDATGALAPNHPVRLRPRRHASACLLNFADRVVTVRPAGVELRTGSMGKLSFGITPEGRGAAAPELTADGLPEPLFIQPGAGVHSYLAGQGRLSESCPSWSATRFGPQASDRTRSAPRRTLKVVLAEVGGHEQGQPGAPGAVVVPWIAALYARCRAAARLCRVLSRRWKPPAKPPFRCGGWSFCGTPRAHGPRVCPTMTAPSVREVCATPRRPAAG
ncbi:hypothetical protein GCM10014713_40840 [Streptomyces purpureus]|uniref:Uncharacterized protein n=1 Tax=Streptomyces purpureus TaxID=1951 RepID=A0A918LSH5_9ACTN|nr:hypothetical protein GCM10014713_40840 [Streptomyces purpureus]